MISRLNLNTIIHSLAFSIFAYTLYYEIYILRSNFPPELVQNASRWKYLTNWNLLLQVVFNLFNVLNDIVFKRMKNSKSSGSKMQKLLDTLYSSWIFPAGIFVSVTFWVLFLYDSRLIMPDSKKAFFPVWYNHCVHTVHLIFLFWEFVFVPKMYPKFFNGGLILFAGISGYIAWITMLEKEWPYPILAKMNQAQVALFISGMALSILAIYATGHSIFQKLDKKRSKSTKSTHKQKNKNK